ncbi:MAG: DUF4304 domain-containing protein [Burkholderiaceae bacterium]
MSHLARLEDSIKEHLAPLLRADGFTGSGRTFRRIVGDFIQVVNVQGSRYGGQFAINLGIQPICVFDVLGQVPDKKKITESLCEFRRRLSASGADQWWKHDTTKESMDSAVKAAAVVYCEKGRQFLGGCEGTSSPFHLITAEAFEQGNYNLNGFGSTVVRITLVLARFRKAQGRFEEAKEFARVGLTAVGNASALRRELESLCAEV